MNNASAWSQLRGAKHKKRVTGVSTQELQNVLKREQEEAEDDDETIKEVNQEASKGLGYRRSVHVLFLFQVFE